jgi:hypothetical protein
MKHPAALWRMANVEQRGAMECAHFFSEILGRRPGCLGVATDRVVVLAAACILPTALF